MELDPFDLKILAHLQSDSSVTLTELADAICLSRNACWRRVQRLEAEGIIRKRVALLDRDRLGRSGTVFVSIRTNDHSEEWTTKFIRAVGRVPQVVEAYRMSGDVDYLLKVIVADIREFDRVYQALIHEIGLSDVNSSFAMECLKETTAVPLVCA
ncbi:Lrp/AsnC family transcriptional regulator [Phenylobacterium sp.]|uniref:Lrp/AsnC family transcriptional regulator n=1 Tax=Phenylobacterium sp. TaxID=1871053 RepID=UPI002FC90E3D